MKKISLFSIIAFSLAILSPLAASAKLKVVTTTTDLAALAKEVGGDLIDVESLARGDQDPHYIEPKPSFAGKMSRADLLIEVGLGLEVGWLPVLLTQSRNQKIQPSAPGHLKASDGIRLLEIPTGAIDRSQGDIHPEGNPHYWLDPRNGLIIAKAITEKLSALDPANAALYQKNFRSFKEDFSKKITLWAKELSPLKGKELVTYHKSLSYFADWAGFNVAGFVEPKPGIPPSPAHILSLIDMIKEKKVPAVITESYYDAKASQQVAEKGSAKLLLIPTSVGGEAGITRYEDLFSAIVKKMKGVL